MACLENTIVQFLCGLKSQIHMDICPVRLSDSQQCLGENPRRALLCSKVSDTLGNLYGLEADLNRFVRPMV
jgi:hypothetical protein